LFVISRCSCFLIIVNKTAKHATGRHIELMLGVVDLSLNTLNSEVGSNGIHETSRDPWRFLMIRNMLCNCTK
jgi:hypothetical protein